MDKEFIRKDIILYYNPSVSFSDSKSRSEWGRKQVKSILSKEFGVPTSSIEIESLDSGKPVIKSHSINISISHSQRLWTMAASSKLKLGLDVEFIQARSQIDKIAKRWMQHALWKLYDAEKNQNLKLKKFFQFWTALEALAKCENKSIWKNSSAIKTENNMSWNLSSDKHELHFLDLVEAYECCICWNKTHKHAQTSIKIVQFS